MSSRKPLPLKLAPKARQDFIDILRFTSEAWGQAQLITYGDKINDALQGISQNPQLGHGRSDLPRPTWRIWLGRTSSSAASARAASTSCASCSSAWVSPNTSERGAMAEQVFSKAN